MVIAACTRFVVVRVTEAFTGSKSPDRPNEDTYRVLEHHVVVIDGATDKSGIRYRSADETVSSGLLAARVVADAFEELDATVTAPSATAAIAFVSARLDEVLLAQQPGLSPHQRPAASVIIYSRARHEVWSVGDCSWRFRDQGRHGGKPIDEITSSLRRAVTEAHLADGWTVEEVARHDPGRAAIESLLHYQGMFANRSHALGYGVVNGMPVPGEFIEVHSLHGSGTLTLTSDGYPEILASRELSEARLSALVGQDPLCIGPLLGPKSAAPGAGVYDDRTWVSVRI